jgi:hypothetical protein
MKQSELAAMMRRVDKLVFDRELRQLKRSKEHLLNQASEPHTDPSPEERL